MRLGSVIISCSLPLPCVVATSMMARRHSLFGTDMGRTQIFLSTSARLLGPEWRKLLMFPFCATTRHYSIPLFLKRTKALNWQCFSANDTILESLQWSDLSCWPTIVLCSYWLVESSTRGQNFCLWNAQLRTSELHTAISRTHTNKDMGFAGFQF